MKQLKINTLQLSRYLFVAFLALIFLAKMVQIELLMYVSIVCGAACLCLSDDSGRVGICLLLLPNIRMFDGLHVKFLVNILLVLPVAAYIIEHRRVNFIALSHVLMLWAWDTSHLLFFNQLTRILPNFSTIIILYYVECVLTDRNTVLDFNDIARKFSFGCIYSAVVSWMNLAIHISSAYAWNQINAWRLYGYAGDPNYFALYIGMSLSMMLLIRGGSRKRDYAYVILLISLALLTASKMSLGILLFIVIFFAGKALYSFLAQRNKFLRRMTLIGIGAALVFSNQIIDLINRTLIRLQEYKGDVVTVDTITSNRFATNLYYSTALIENPALLILGYGMQYNELDYFQKIQMVSHNTFLDLILSWGLVGVAMITIILFTIIRQMNRNRREKLNLNHFFPLIICMLSFLALSCLSSTMFWWVVCAALLPLKGLENEASAHYRDRTGVQRRKVHLKVRRVAH